jgi:hypothetical protein
MGVDCSIIHKGKTYYLDRLYVFENIREISWGEHNNVGDVKEGIKYHVQWLNEALNILDKIKDSETVVFDHDFMGNEKDEDYNA